jgi:uncharacterized protein (TIGR03437 family)
MYSIHSKSLLPLAALALFGLAAANGQTQDTSGNSLLSGSFRFRHVAVLDVDENFDPAEIAASYGTITFNGAGKYTITGTTMDNTIAGGAAQPLNVAGTYAIGSNGTGYVANPLSPTDYNVYMYGAVSQGVYTGSSTEAWQANEIMNDIFIAIPVGSAPTNASFTSSYQTGLLDFAGAGPSAIKNALFELSPNGQGKFGAITLSGQASNQSASSLTQSIAAGATYNFNADGSATLTIPLPAGVISTNALFTGSKTIFESANGNFILGWTAGGYDIFFGVKALGITGVNSLSGGLYFTAALEDIAGTGFGTDSYYGGTSNNGDNNGDGIVHQRVNLPELLSFDYGTDDQIDLNSDGTTPSDFNGYTYIFGDSGTCLSGATLIPCAQAFVAIGTNGYFSLVVGMHAPSFSGPGVYLNPIGVVNAANYQPITASLAPGELITLFGTGLAPVPMAMQTGQPFLPTLAGVSASINGLPCPVYYVSSTQMSVIVPYAVALNQTGLANIQVNNNGVLSNVVQMYLTDSSPGSFSLGQNGLGYAAARDAVTGVAITSSHPAQPGEYIALYVTGLGTVTPAIADGAVGPSSPFSVADLYGAGFLGVLLNDYGPNGSSTGILGTIQYAGLAPTLAGLYQLNVQVPASGLGAGDNIYVQFVTDAADVNQIQIPYGSSGASVVSAAQARVNPSRAQTLARALSVRAMRSHGSKPSPHRVKRGAPAAAPR